MKTIVKILVALAVLFGLSSLAFMAWESTPQAHQPVVYNAPEPASTASETLVLSKNLARSDVPRDFPQDWGRVTYNLNGGGTYHIIVKTTGIDDAVDVSIQYQRKQSVDKFGNIYYQLLPPSYVGSANAYTDLDTTATIPQDSIQQIIILIVKGQNGIISLNVYKVR